MVSVSGECHGESILRDNDVFCAVSFSGTMWSAVLVLLEKCFWWQRKFFACGPMPCHFFEHPTPACPRPMTDAGQHSLHFMVNTAVETRLCHATLSCSDPKPDCQRATTRCPGAVDTTPPCTCADAQQYFQKNKRFLATVNLLEGGTCNDSLTTVTT